MHVLIQLQNNNWFTKSNVNLSSIRLLAKLQSVHPKQNQKQILYESNKLCIHQTGRKSYLKCQEFKNKANFISNIGDKFAMIIK